MLQRTAQARRTRRTQATPTPTRQATRQAHKHKHKHKRTTRRATAQPEEQHNQHEEQRKQANILPALLFGIMLYSTKQSRQGRTKERTKETSCQFFQRSKRQGKGRTRPSFTEGNARPRFTVTASDFSRSPLLATPFNPSISLPLFNCTIFIILPNCSVCSLLPLTSCSLLEQALANTSSGAVQLESRGWGVFFVQVWKLRSCYWLPKKLNKGSLGNLEQLSPGSFTDKKLSMLDLLVENR